MRAETGPNGTASATTQSRANPVSCDLRKNPRFSATFAQAGAAVPVSAVGKDESRGPKRRPSLARANPFPANFIPTDGDAFACRLRPVRIHGRRELGEVIRAPYGALDPILSTLGAVSNRR
jgi:hypothetical protein